MDVAVGALVNGNQLDIYIKRVKKGHTKHTRTRFGHTPSSLRVLICLFSFLSFSPRSLPPGQYFIGDVRDPKIHFVRQVRHLVLVRVGGGWESFLETGQRKFEAQATEEAKALQIETAQAANKTNEGEQKDLDEY